MGKEQLMLWKAIYKDGSEIKEEVNTFDDIDREKIEYFIMDGMETTFTHCVETGLIKINDQTIVMLLNDKLIGKSSDVINYKEKLKTAIGPNMGLDDNIIGYYTGWKEKTSEFENVEVLFWVDMIKQEVKVRLGVTPKNVDCLNNEFTMIINGQMISTKLECSDVMKRHEFIFELF